MVTRKSSSKKAASAKNKENNEKTSEDEKGVDLSICPCKDCHATIEIKGCHGSYCCFNPNESFEERVTEVMYCDNLCSPYCFYVAKTLFNITLSPQYIITLFCSIEAEDFDLKESFLAMSLLEDAARSCPDSKVGDNFFPNYIVNNMSESDKYVVFLAIYAGFNYDSNSTSLIKFVGKFLARPYGIGELGPDCHWKYAWLEILLEQDQCFQKKIRQLFLKATSTYSLDEQPEEEEREDEDSEDS